MFLKLIHSTFAIIQASKLKQLVKNVPNITNVEGLLTQVCYCQKCYLSDSALTQYHTYLGHRHILSFWHLSHKLSTIHSGRFVLPLNIFGIMCFYYQIRLKYSSQYRVGLSLLNPYSFEFSIVWEFIVWFLFFPLKW